MPLQRPAIAALLLFAVCSCTGSQGPVPAPPGAIRVLFIGNSYTDYNGSIPAVLQAMADQTGVPLVAHGSLSWGRSLEWHFHRGQARRAIARGGWDYVVLQDHSRQAFEHPEKLAEYARRFDEQIQRIGARTVFFVTWARQHQPDKQAVIVREYERAALEMGAMIAPVGLAWQRVIREDAEVKLHTNDRSHPTPAGSYLAACVFYHTLLGEPPAPLPAKIQTGKVTIDLPPEQALVLQRAAAAVSAGTASQPVRP